MTKPEVIAGLKRLSGYNFKSDEIIFQAAISLLEKEPEVMGGEELRHFIVRFIAGKHCSERGFMSRIVGKDELYELAAALSNRIAKPQPPEEKPELPEEVSFDNEPLGERCGMLARTINALICWAKDLERRSGK